MPEARIAAPPTPSGDPHTSTADTVEYEVLHGAGGHRCGIVAKGDQSGRVMEALCQREGVAYDPGEARTGKVRWVPARSELKVNTWLLPVEDGGDVRGAFLATYIDNR